MDTEPTANNGPLRTGAGDQPGFEGTLGPNPLAQFEFCVLLTAGSRPLPEYRLVRQLGRGGFGEVWQADGPGGFPVALKFVRLGAEAHQSEVRAVELMKGIRHGNLLPMFGTWQRDGLLIVAMELADSSLADRLRAVQREGLPGIPAAELADYLLDAAKGLDYLNEPRHPSLAGHAVGIQHKDVKPANLLLVGGSVKVADFGLAKLMEHSVSLASAGGMTPSYAAPEFFRGQATRWSDQYCLAVSYCELRGGRLPFVGNVNEIMLGHTQDAPDLTMLPAGERPAVARALAKRPEDRWPSCREFADAVGAALRAPATAPPPPRDGESRLADFLRAAFERTRGRPTAEDTAAARTLCRELGIATARARVIIAEVRDQWTRGRPARAARRPGEMVTNSLGMSFVWCPPTAWFERHYGRPFLIGSPPDEEGRNDDEVQRRVTLTRGFYLGAHPVTQAQWRAVMGDSPGRSRGDTLPVEMVSWEECRAFCARLGERDGARYGLPTEAEWEYACRAGTITPYHFGAALTAGLANCNGNYAPDRGAKAGSRGGLSPVGSYPANAWGLFDTHGNVWEWCADWYGSYPPGPLKDPRGPRSGDARVQRGGSWAAFPAWCRTACRDRRAPDGRGDVGCRLVFVPPAG